MYFFFFSHCFDVYMFCLIVLVLHIVGSLTMIVCLMFIHLIFSLSFMFCEFKISFYLLDLYSIFHTCVYGLFLVF